MRRGYNGLKRHALYIYERAGWLGVPAWAAAAGLSGPLTRSCFGSIGGACWNAG